MNLQLYLTVVAMWLTVLQKLNEPTPVPYCSKDVTNSSAIAEWAYSSTLLLQRSN